MINTQTEADIDPIEQERRHAAAFVAYGAWSRCNVKERWPLPTDDAVTLLRDGQGFDVDREELLDLVIRQHIQRPGVDEVGGFEWNATDLAHASRALHSREQWMPGRYDEFKSESQRMLESAREEGNLGEIVDEANRLAGAKGTPTWDLRDLLILLKNANGPELRNRLLMRVKAELELRHGVIVK